MFGYALHESYLQYPGVLTSREITRRLGVSYNAAQTLKRRLQLFASDHMAGVRKLMREELRRRFHRFNLPRDRDADLSRYSGKRIPAVDSVVLFSASQRANKGRKRHRHGGATASIYMSDNLGGRQVGTLTQLISWKGGPLVVDSIPDQQMGTLKPLLDSVLSPQTPVYTDEGYRFLYRVNRNHRMVNHSARSKDARWKYARHRWCRKGVHSQVAEGNGRLIKSAFSAYGWIKPEHSTLYLNEFSFIRSSLYFGLEEIAKATRALQRTGGQSNPHQAHLAPHREPVDAPQGHPPEVAQTDTHFDLTKLSNQNPQGHPPAVARTGTRGETHPAPASRTKGGATARTDIQEGHSTRSRTSRSGHTTGPAHGEGQTVPAPLAHTRGGEQLRRSGAIAANRVRAKGDGVVGRGGDGVPKAVCGFDVADCLRNEGHRPSLPQYRSDR